MTVTSHAVADTLSVVRTMTFLHRLEWTLNGEPIALSRQTLSGEEEQTGSFEEQPDDAVTVAELQSFVSECIPQVSVQLKVCRL